MSAVIQDVSSQKLSQALGRLNDLLPLKARQDSLTPAQRQLHRAILRSLVERGCPSDADEIAKVVGGGEAGTLAVAVLGANDLVVRGTLSVADARTGKAVALDAMGGDVVGAYPVTLEKTPHRIKVNGHDLYAMCAVDALAVATLFAAEVEIDSVCHVTGVPIRIRQRGKEVLNSAPAARDIRVGVRWQRVATAAAHSLCRQMVFLKDAATAAGWQGSDPASIDIYTVAEAIDFGEAFFTPLLRD